MLTSTRITKKSAGSGLAFVILILGLIVVALIFFRKDAEKALQGKRRVLVGVIQRIERKTYIFAHDDYVASFAIWHDEEMPLSGKIVVEIPKEYGQFRPLEDDSAKEWEIEENKVTIRTYNWSPGKSNAKTVYFMLKNSQLNESGLTPDEVAKRAPLIGRVYFYPLSDSPFEDTWIRIGFGEGS